ncbi:MAG TPA: HAD hydrolase family protein [Bdellovibrionales bacterium]|nr:HAD hydrolase family protein [Bdellovibrionales bacterium]
MNRIPKLKAVVFDVDGVFTHDQSRHVFSVRDTMAIRTMRKAGYKIGVLTTTRSLEIRTHVEFVGIDAFSVSADKSRALAEMLSKFGVDSNEACFVSRDRNDIELIRGVGFGVALVTSDQETQQAARFVTSKPGGDGAIFEICNLILTHKNIREMQL